MALLVLCVGSSWSLPPVSRAVTPAACYQRWVEFLSPLSFVVGTVGGIPVLPFVHQFLENKSLLLNARPVYGRPNRLPIGMNNSMYLRECIRVNYVSFWKDLKNLVIRKRRTDVQQTSQASLLALVLSLVFS